MKYIHNSQSFDIVPDVKVTIKSRSVKVKGKYGELKRDFRHLPIDFQHNAQKRNVKVALWRGTTVKLAALRTVCSHIKNMMTGVTKKYQYKMRLVYAHFPIGVNIIKDGKALEIRNFLGEKKVRVVNMLEDVKIDKSKDVKDEFIITGPSLERVSRSCALIHQVCLVKHKDIRKFLDGIYVSEKGTVEP